MPPRCCLMVCVRQFLLSFWTLCVFLWWDFLFPTSFVNHCWGDCLEIWAPSGILFTSNALPQETLLTYHLNTHRYHFQRHYWVAVIQMQGKCFHDIPSTNFMHLWWKVFISTTAKHCWEQRFWYLSIALSPFVMFNVLWESSLTYDLCSFKLTISRKWIAEKMIGWQASLPRSFEFSYFSMMIMSSYQWLLSNMLDIFVFSEFWIWSSSSHSDNLEETSLTFHCCRNQDWI